MVRCEGSVEFRLSGIWEQLIVVGCKCYEVKRGGREEPDRGWSQYYK